MAVRVTTTEVKEVIETELTDLSVFITAANIQVNRVAAVDADVPAATLKEIERWLAAHYTAIRDKRTAESDVGDAAFKYEGRTAMGLDFTRYGQQAKELDPTGTLKDFDLRKASVAYLGRTAQDGEMVDP